MHFEILFSFNNIANAKLFKNGLHHHFYTPEVNIQLQIGHGASTGKSQF